MKTREERHIARSIDKLKKIQEEVRRPIQEV